MIDLSQIKTGEKTNPLFIDIKGRWHNVGLLAYSPDSQSYYGVLIIVKLKTNWDDTILFPFLLSLAVELCQQEGLIPTRQACQCLITDKSNEMIVTEKARALFKVYCNDLWKSVILSWSVKEHLPI